MIPKRLDYLRLSMKKEGVDVCYLNTTDYHMSEYVSEYFRTIAYFSGFTGSLATLLVDYEKAYLFVDGRYHLQAEEQCSPYGIEIVKLGTQGAKEPLDFIEENYKGKILAIDGKRTSVSFGKELEKRHISFRMCDVYSSVMEGRAPFPSGKVFELPYEYTGKKRSEKLRDVFFILSGKCHVVDSPETIAYVLNLRGSDVNATPVFLSYLVFLKDEVYLFADLERFDEDILDRLYADGVIIRPYDSYYDFLREIKGEVVLYDENKVNYETYSLLRRRNKLFSLLSVIDEMKSIKNETEIENTRKAHIYDGVTMVRFIRWLKENDLTSYTEYDVMKKLEGMRKGNRAYDASFGAIVGYNENAAVVHYAPQKETAKKLENQGILLVDSGGQYYEGTTDITRTVCIGEVDPEVRKWFTLVLRSMFHLSEAVFLYGSSGRSLDVLARKDLWKEGVNYMHGTGHGVGQFLSVHESPPSVRSGSMARGMEDEPLRPGNILSDEPGIYFAGKYGIRCENLVLCKQLFENEYGRFLGFETLTLAPFDLDLVDRDYLSDEDVRVLNDYHERVYNTLSPYLDEEEKAFLRHETRRIV